MVLLWVVPGIVVAFLLWVVGSTIYEFGYSKAYWERTEQIDRLLGLRDEDD